jgi:hypothetical protein
MDSLTPPLHLHILHYLDATALAAAESTSRDFNVILPRVARQREAALGLKWGAARCNENLPECLAWVQHKSTYAFGTATSARWCKTLRRQELALALHS